MTFYPKGSLIISDGDGKVTAFPPNNDDMIPVFDSKEPKGLKWINDTSNDDKLLKFSIDGNNFVDTNEYYAIMDISIPENITTINKINVISHMHNNANNYDIRIYDVTNDSVIAEASFNNKKMEIKDIGTISNTPQDSAIFEIQLKVDASKKAWRKVYIKEISIYYV